MQEGASGIEAKLARAGLEPKPDDATTFFAGVAAAAAWAAFAVAPAPAPAAMATFPRFRSVGTGAGEEATSADAMTGLSFEKRKRAVEKV